MKTLGRLSKNQCSRCKHPSQAEPGQQRCRRCNKKNSMYLQSKTIKERRALSRKLRMQNPETRKRTYQNNYRSKDKHFFAARAAQINYRHNVALTAKQLARLWHVQKGLCPISGARLNIKNAHLDHILPRSRGGLTTLANLRWVHEFVNRAKWLLSDADLILWCRKVVAYADTKH